MTDVVERLLEQARRHPDAPAVVARGEVTTYAAFCARAGDFAAAMAAKARPRVLVAIEKGRDAYAAMFGTLMAGGVYAPVNVSSPLARLAQIRDAFDPDVIVAEGILADDLADGARAQRIDPVSLAPAAVVPAGGTDVDLGEAGLAYVIFTSGSTGAPKGVAISRAALAHYVDWLGPAMEIGPGERMSQHPNIGFDLSVLDIYGALCWGAALHPFVETSARLLPARKVEAEKITIWNSVPSVVSIMATAGELDAAHLASVRLFTFCGEVLRQDHVAGILAARPDATILNTYGPTEATVAMTCRHLASGDETTVCAPSAPLGEAIGDMRLDLDGGGDSGEIVISGPQLAERYWGDPALTATKFRDFTRPDGRVVRAFYTGDYAERIGGDLYFLDRRDDMVKVRGHRIHLGEIRRTLDRLGWPAAFVFERDQALFAVVERSTASFNEGALIERLGEELDKYFVPQAIRCVDVFPRNANDKIDAGALRRMFDLAVD